MPSKEIAVESAAPGRTEIRRKNRSPELSFFPFLRYHEATFTRSEEPR